MMLGFGPAKSHRTRIFIDVSLYIFSSNGEPTDFENMRLKHFVCVLPLLGAWLARGQQSPVPELHSGDHVAIIGSTMADRFQHSGWLETYLYSSYPDLNLVFRDLAVP